MNIDKTKLTCVTGANGFIGRHVVKELQNRGYNVLPLMGRKDYDLTQEKEVKRLFYDNDYQISYILHLSAKCGGISANVKHSAEFFTQNILQGTYLINEAARNKIEKFVLLSTICAYPSVTDFKETSLWNGREEVTNRNYSAAKRALHVLLEGYNEVMPGNIILLGNSYGQFDNFNENGHVIPNIIEKFNNHKNLEEPVVFLGDGSPTRTFTHSDDSSRGIVEVFEKYHSIEPINIGSEEEISIKDLVKMIATLMNFKGSWIFDNTQPNGQLRRKLDCTKARNEIGFECNIPLCIGLMDTINWYLKNKDVHRV